MAKISNIGVLNVANIKEDLAEEITELNNIGLLIESDKSQLLLKNSKKINIGSTIVVPSDIKVDYILKNGFIEIDQDFVEGLSSPIVLLVNGEVIFHNDIDPKLLDEKLYKLMLNGHLICPGKLKGIIEPRATINGITKYYKNDHKYISGNTMITNRFLKGLKPDSKLAFSRLMVIDEIDMELFKDKIENIQVLDKFVIMEKYDWIFSYIENSFNIETAIIPDSENKVKYLSDNLIIDDNSITGYNKEILYVEGEVEIYLKGDIEFSDYISHLICDTLICDEKIYNNINNILGEDTKVQIVRGKLLKNTGKMVLSQDFEERVSIKNMGKLVIGKDINPDNFNLKVTSIQNYGVIEVPKDKMTLVENKIKENFGKVKELKENIEIKEDKEKEDILYANIGELKL